MTHTTACSRPEKASQAERHAKLAQRRRQGAGGPAEPRPMAPTRQLSCGSPFATTKTPDDGTRTKTSPASASVNWPNNDCVNHMCTLGQWVFAELTDIDQIEEDFSATVDETFETMIARASASPAVSA